MLPGIDPHYLIMYTFSKTSLEVQDYPIGCMHMHLSRVMHELIDYTHYIRNVWSAVIGRSTDPPASDISPYLR